jgi:hypothetical protein
LTGLEAKPLIGKGARVGAGRAQAASMRNLPPFRFLPLLLAVSLGAACTESDDPPKLVSVANQTPEPHRVQFGTSDFGVVAAETVTEYLEVPDGENVVLMDGREVLRTELGSDNVGGSWTLYLQGSGDQIGVGVVIDDE